MTRSLKVYQGEDQTPIFDYTDDVIWERVEAGHRAYKSEAISSQFPMRDEQGETGSSTGLPAGLTQKGLPAGARLEWLEGSTRMFFGRIGPKDYSRGAQKADRAREVVVNASDINYDLRNIIVDGWDRPSETDVARVLALVADYLTGSPRVTTDLSTTYVATGSNLVTLPPRVYDATDPAEVVADIATVANKLHFITIDGELFYDGWDSATYRAGIRISDRLSEVNTEGECAFVTPTIVDTTSGQNGGTTDQITVPVGLVNGAFIIAVPLGVFGVGLPANVYWTIGASNYAATLVDSEATADVGMAIYRLVNPVAGSGTLSADGKALGVWLLSGVDQTTPVSTYDFASGTSATSAVSITPPSGGTLLDAVHFFDNDFTNDADPFTITPTGGQTEDFQELHQYNSPGYADQLFAGGHGDPSPGWTGNQSRPWTAVAFAVNGVDIGGDILTFPPIWDVGPSSTEDGTQLLSGLRLYYGQGSNTYVYVNDPATANAYWHSEQSLYTDDPAITTPARATTLASAILQRRKYEDRTYNVSIGPLNEDQVACIKPGQLISIKARAIPDADDAFVSRRIAQLKWSTPVPQMFFAHMQLDRPIKESPYGVGPKTATDSINRHVGQGSNSHPEYVLRSTLTTQGDLPFRGASDWTRRAIGGSNLILASDGSSPVWAHRTASGLTNPMTTAGDIIKGGTAGAAERLAIGSAGQVLKVVSGAPAWGTDETGAGGSGGSSDWWHHDNAPASPNAANEEMNDGGVIGTLTRVSHGTPKGTWAEVAGGLEWTFTANGATDLDVFAVPLTLSVGDYLTIAYQSTPYWVNSKIGAFVGFSDGTTFGTSDAVGAWSTPSAPFIHLLNDWANMNSRASDGTVFQETMDYGSRWGMRIKYEASNTWGIYSKPPGGGWRVIQTNYPRTLTPTHALFGVAMNNNPTFSTTVPNVVRLECFRVND
jgi:hypothetical protein